jgi:hypothetical protein
MNQETIKKCYDKFELRERRGQGNQMFKYVNSKDIIHRMNTLFAGNWSSEVLSTDTIDNQVIVRVRVYITDPETGKLYYHEGFGSSQIARYTGGQNEGKIIDIGNAYKGALSKGIVNACRMWGVGLFKEADFEFEEDDDGDFTAPSIPPVPTAASLPETKPAPLQPVVVATSAPAIPVMASPAVSAMPARPTLPSAADMPVRPTASLSRAPVTSMVAEPAPIVPAPPSASPAPTVDLPFSATQPETVNKINDVQKVAISGILTLRKMTYDQLATEAFADAGAPGYQYPPVEQLTYDEAVVVIKYGNNKFRKH